MKFKISQIATLTGLLSFFSYCSLSAECIPTDQAGKACISLISKDEQQKSQGGTDYILTFKNSCSSSIIVNAQRMIHMKLGDSGISSGSIAANGTGKITCTDRLGSESNCRGFSSWWAKCF
jgi:hypothetical protein